MEKGPTLFELQGLEASQLDILRKCQEWGLIPREGTYMCPLCGNPLKLGANTSSKDGYRWVCNRKYTINKKRKLCNIRISLRTKTFFEKSQLSIKQILGFVSMWIHSCKLTFIELQLSITQQTSVDWASFCREVAYVTMIERQEPIGGEGKTVEIHVGRIPRDNWVFGGFERGSGRVFMVTVKARSRETLISMINKWIIPGTNIISDCWKTFNSLSNEGFQHENVNHSIRFIDPETGAHTNNIESAWKAAKLSITPQNRKPKSLSGNLARYMLLKKANVDGMDPVLLFYRMAGQLYNPLLEGAPDIRRPEQPGEVEENSYEKDNE